MTTGKWITLTDFLLSSDWLIWLVSIDDAFAILPHARREELARTSVFLWEASTWGTGLNHHNGNFSTNMLLRLWLEDRHFAYRYSWSGEYRLCWQMIELTSGNGKMFQKRGFCLHIMFGSQMPPTSTCDIPPPPFCQFHSHIWEKPSIPYRQALKLKLNSKQFRRHGGSGKDQGHPTTECFQIRQNCLG